MLQMHMVFGFDERCTCVYCNCFIIFVVIDLYVKSFFVRTPICQVIKYVLEVCNPHNIHKKT